MAEETKTVRSYNESRIKLKVYKATDKDMKCRGLQYEIGKTVEADGNIKLCKNGLHACEAPLDLFGYYSPADGSRYFEAEAEEVSPEREDNSSKVVARKLTLGAEIGIPGLVKAHIEYVKEAVKDCKDGGSAGNLAQIGSSGDWAKIGSSGDWAKIGSSGYGAKIGSSGDWAQIGSSGDGAKIECNGKNAVVMCAGKDSKARGPVGTWITLAEYDEEGICILCKSERIDGETLKPDTWYTLKGGEFVEVE
jgi:hypothetical protein